MKHAFNLQAIVGKMKKKPANHRLYLFFYGVLDALTIEEIKKLKAAASKEHRKFCTFLDKAIAENKSNK